MFSNIQEAWDNDPMQEMTRKLTKMNDGTDNDDPLVSPISDIDNYIMPYGQLDTNKCSTTASHVAGCHKCKDWLENVINRKLREKMAALYVEDRISNKKRSAGGITIDNHTIMAGMLLMMLAMVMICIVVLSRK